MARRFKVGDHVVWITAADWYDGVVESISVVESDDDVSDVATIATIRLGSTSRDLKLNELLPKWHVDMYTSLRMGDLVVWNSGKKYGIVTRTRYIKNSNRKLVTVLTDGTQKELSIRTRVTWVQRSK